MNVYCIDVPLYATAYVKAETAEQAKEKFLNELADSMLDVSEGTAGEVEISGRMYGDPELPELSLSPAMTIAGREVLEENCRNGGIELVHGESIDV